VTNLGECRTWVEGILKPTHPCRDGDYFCLDVGERPLLNNIRRGLIDPDTPESAMTKKNADGKEWKLVVSVVSLP
jgi:hypothetical protein